MLFCVLYEGFIPGAGIPLQKQLEHANQQSGFTDAVRRTLGKGEIIFTSRFQDWRFIVVVLQGALRPMPPPSIHPSASGLLPTPSMTVQIPTAKVTHQTTAQDSRFFRENGWNPECNCGVFLPQSPFQSSPQGAPRHGFLSHSQTSQRFYPHGK